MSVHMDVIEGVPQLGAPMSQNNHCSAWLGAAVYYMGV